MSKPSIIGGLGVSHYQESHASALADPEGFWAEAAKEALTIADSGRLKPAVL